MPRLPSVVRRARGPLTFIIAIALLLFGYGSGAYSASGPFAGFDGAWEGVGTIRLTDGKKERIRCRAAYRVRGSSQRNVDLQLACQSDSYKFDLVGDFSADDSARISGRWTERNRRVGGTVIGQARGDRLQIYAETSGFSAELILVTRNRRQAVTIDSRGGGETALVSIALRRK